MISHAIQWGIRGLRILPVLMFMFSGCTCSEEPPASSAPQAEAPAQTPTSAAPPTNTPEPATPTVAAEPTPPSPATGESAAIPSECETYVEVLSGRNKDLSLLDKSKITGMPNPHLVMCGAVFSDSDAICKKLMGTERGPSKECRRTWSTFHELRTYPQGRSFMFDVVDWEECRSAPFPGPEVCDAFREALRSADVTKCAAAAPLESICRAYIELDPSLCRIEAELEQTTIEITDKGSPETFNIKEGYEEGCRQTIAERASLAAGLEALTKADEVQQQELAKAALGQTEACAPFVTEAKQVCASTMRPTPSAAEGAPAAPAAEGAPAAPAAEDAPPVPAAEGAPPAPAARDGAPEAPAEMN